MDDYIPKLTLKNVRKIPFKKMLDALKPYTLEEVPEGVLGDVDAYMEIERLLGRFANLYAYMITLYAYLANEVNRSKLAGDDMQKDILIRKRDAIYELSRAVKYKYDACSRMLTAVMGYDEKETTDNPNLNARVKSEPKTKKKMRGWGNVS